MNYNRTGTFGSRPQSAGYGRARRGVAPKNNFVKKPSDGPTLVQPEWNQGNENPHKLSKAELLQRKMLAKSKHEQTAKVELQQKLTQLE